MWMVRNSGGKFADQFIEHGVIALGWKNTGSLLSLKSREKIIQKVREVWPEYKPMKAVTTGSQLNKLANVMKNGDKVVTYDPSTRVYNLGTITGDYSYDDNAEDGRSHSRKVKWEYSIDRDKLSVSAKNSLGSTLTIFSIPDEVVAEFERQEKGKKEKNTEVAPTEEEENEQLVLASTQEKAREFIKDRIDKIDWDEMQELVAGVLRAMGYKTRVSPEGPDRGKDIVASPDGLGLEQPRIVVEVKHREGKMGSKEIRSFLGGRHKDDKGLYISTGGFSKDAKMEADRAAIPLTLMDIDEFVDLLITHYEKLDIAARAILPLTRIYWPS